MLAIVRPPYCWASLCEPFPVVCRCVRTSCSKRESSRERFMSRRHQAHLTPTHSPDESVIHAKAGFAATSRSSSEAKSVSSGEQTDEYAIDDCFMSDDHALNLRLRSLVVSCELLDGLLIDRHV